MWNCQVLGIKIEYVNFKQQNNLETFVILIFEKKEHLTESIFSVGIWKLKPYNGTSLTFTIILTYRQNNYRRITRLYYGVYGKITVDYNNLII